MHSPTRETGSDKMIDTQQLNTLKMAEWPITDFDDPAQCVSRHTNPPPLWWSNGSITIWCTDGRPLRDKLTVASRLPLCRPHSPGRVPENNSGVRGILPISNARTIPYFIELLLSSSDHGGVRIEQNYTHTQVTGYQAVTS